MHLSPLLTVRDVAAIVGLSEDAVRDAISDGELKATRLRRRIKITEDAVADWIENGQIQGAPAGPHLRATLNLAATTTAKPLKPGDAMARMQEARRRRAA